MECYVNPVNQSKEEFLNENDTLVSNLIGWEEIPKDKLPVILINNGPFTAAGIAYCEDEFNAFTMPNDNRPKMLFLVSIEDLKTVSDIEDYLK